MNLGPPVPGHKAYYHPAFEQWRERGEDWLELDWVWNDVLASWHLCPGPTKAVKKGSSFEEPYVPREPIMYQDPGNGCGWLDVEDEDWDLLMDLGIRRGRLNGLVC